MKTSKKLPLSLAELVLLLSSNIIEEDKHNLDKHNLQNGRF